MDHEVVAEGLCNVEGPTIGPDGWLINVCSVSRPTETWPTRGGDITATRIEGPPETHVLFSTSTDKIEGIPAALAFGPDEAVYICDEGRRSVVRVGPDGVLCDFVDTYEGDRINGPNDLSFDPDGNLYFTDPWTSSPLNPVANVFGYNWATKGLSLIDSGMQFTNGIVAREGRLFVAETYTRMVWVYDIDAPGHASKRRPFCQLPDIDDPPLLSEAVRQAVGVDYVVGPDGMCFDEDGNLYVAHYGGDGVFVYDRNGVQVEVIQTPGRFPTNVCFGGDDHQTLFISVDDPGTIIACKPGPTGEQLPFCPSRVAGHAFARMLGPGGPAELMAGHRRLDLE